VNKNYLPIKIDDQESKFENVITSIHQKLNMYLQYKSQYLKQAIEIPISKKTNIPDTINIYTKQITFLSRKFPLLFRGIVFLRKKL